MKVPETIFDVHPGRNPEYPVEKDRPALGLRDSLDPVGFEYQPAGVGIQPTLQGTLGTHLPPSRGQTFTGMVRNLPEFPGSSGNQRSWSLVFNRIPFGPGLPDRFVTPFNTGASG